VLSAFVAVDFQAIYSEEAKPYFGAIWGALLNSIADLAVAEAPYVSGSLQDFVVICFGDFDGARPPAFRRPSLFPRAPADTRHADDDHVGVEDLLQLLGRAPAAAPAPVGLPRV
jgi:hypothetical protein